MAAPATDDIDLENPSDMKSSTSHGTTSRQNADVCTPREKRTPETTTTAVSSETPTDSNAPSRTEEPSYPSGPRLYLLLLTLFATISLTAIDMSIVATAVPRITDRFHTSADVGWYAIAFRLSQCAFRFLYGQSYKLFSIKNVFLIANAFSALGSLLCGLATSSAMLVVGRAIAGVGTAGLGSGALMMLVQSTPLHTRGTWMGLWGAVEGTATIAGPLIGGAITQTIGWRWCFWINLPIGGATLMLTYFCFHEAPKTSDVPRLSRKEKFTQLDILSTAILVPALTCLFLALSWGGQPSHPWNSPTIIALLILSVLLGCAFAYNQSRLGPLSSMPPIIIRQRTVLSSLIFVILQNSSGNVLEYYLPIFYQAVLAYTPAQSGLLMLPYLIAATLGAILSGIGTSVIGYYVPFMIFAAISMPVGAGIITTFGLTTGLAKIIFLTGIFGLGYGAGSTGPATAVQTVLSDSDVSQGLAALSFGGGVGPAVWIAVAQVIFTARLEKQLHALIPGLGKGVVEQNGLTDLVRKVGSGKERAVQEGIDVSLRGTWYLGLALAAVMVLPSLTVEWRSMKKAKASTAAADADAASQDEQSVGASVEDPTKEQKRCCARSSLFMIRVFVPLCYAILGRLFSQDFHHTFYRMTNPVSPTS